MGDFPIIEPGPNEAGGVATSTDYGKALPKGASPNNKGAWQTLLTTTHPCNGLLFHVNRQVVGGYASPIHYLVDVGVGSQTYIQNIHVTGSPRSLARNYWFPMRFPEDVDIKARMQADRSAVSGPDLYVGCTTVSGGFGSFPGFQSSATYGVLTASSKGTQIDPGGTANTKGGWVQLTSSTVHRHRWMVLVLAMFNANAANAHWRVDVGVGASGSETVILGDALVRSTSTADHLTPNCFSIPRVIPKSKRLAVQAQCDITDATDRLLFASVIGLD
jgi:hypothetical protein